MITQNNNVFYITPPSVQKHVEAFFVSFNGKSTGENYRRDLNLFFKEIKNKELKHLTVEDLKIDLSDVQNFKSLLASSGKFKNGSINRALSAVKSFYEHLAAHNEYRDFINLAMFKKVKKLPKDTIKIDIFSESEAKTVLDLALFELHSPKEKHALIRLAIETSIRKEAIREIRYCDFFPHKTRDDRMVIASDDIFDKGKMVSSKEITMELYNMIMELKGDRSDTDKVFTLSSSGIDEVIKRLCKKAGLDARRNLSFHSLKKTGVQYVYETRGLRSAQIQAGHNDPATTSAAYIKEEVNMAPEMFCAPEDSFIANLSKEQMLELYESLTGSAAQAVREKAKELFS